MSDTELEPIFANQGRAKGAKRELAARRPRYPSLSAVEVLIHPDHVSGDCFFGVVELAGKFPVESGGKIFDLLNEFFRGLGIGSIG